MTAKYRRSRPSPALVISCLALFVALTGSALAAGVVGKNSVRSPQIVDGAIHSVDVQDGAVGTTKLAPAAVGTTQIAHDAIGAAQVQEGAIGASELALTTGMGIGVDVPPGEEAQAIAECPPGTTLLSGGAQSNSPALTIYETAPYGNGWIVKAHNSGNTKKGLGVLAHCLSNISH